MAFKPPYITFPLNPIQEWISDTKTGGSARIYWEVRQFKLHEDSLAKSKAGMERIMASSCGWCGYPMSDRKYHTAKLDCRQRRK